MCICDTVRRSESFSGWDDFDKFRGYIQGHFDFYPVPVVVPYSNVGLAEEWYRCGLCNSVWRLVEPDPPFAGLWQKIK